MLSLVSASAFYRLLAFINLVISVRARKDCFLKRAVIKTGLLVYVELPFYINERSSTAPPGFFSVKICA